MKKAAKSPDGESRCKNFKITGLALFKCAKSAHWWMQMSPAFAADLAIWHSCCAAEDGLNEGFSQCLLQQLRCSCSLFSPWDSLFFNYFAEKNGWVWVCVTAWMLCFLYQGVHELIICSQSHCMRGYALLRPTQHFWSCGDRWGFRTFIYLPEANRGGQVGPGSGPHLWLQLPMRNGDQRPPSQRTWRAWADHLCGVRHQASPTSNAGGPSEAEWACACGL